MKFLNMLLMMAVNALIALIVGPARHAVFVGRSRTADIAFTGRMGAGIAGDVNRTHPVSIAPELIDVDDPAEAYGWPVLVDAVTGGMRQFIVADQSDAVAVRPWGFTVRPYPQQVESATNYGAAAFGGAIPPVTGIIDVMKLGYIMAKVNGAPVKGGKVYVWCTASAGAHVQGQLEAAFDAGDTAELQNCFFNGPADANGIAEVVLQD